MEKTLFTDSDEINMPEKIYNSDLYQYKIGSVWFNKEMHQTMATFDVFFRKAPNDNGFAIMAGNNQVLDLIRIINLDENGIEYGEKLNLLYHLVGNMKFVQYVSELKFTGSIWMMDEGEIVWPNEPFMKITAPIVEAQILETPILSIVNHAMNVATKASRVVRAAQGIPVSSFGSRRAHGPWASVMGDRAAYIGGCSSVSNIMAAHYNKIDATGTMSHSYVESFNPENELEAFKSFIENTDENTPKILLIDTYNTLESGILNAIMAFEETDVKSLSVDYGIRIDSGDLAYLSKKCREKLDACGFADAKIILTNGLDENIIRELLLQGAKVDCFGVGDAIACCKGDPCFGAVFKLTEFDEEPTIKLSDDRIKITNPGNNGVIRIYDNNDMAIMDLIAKYNDDSQIESILNNEDIILRDEIDGRKKTVLKSGEYKFKLLLRKVVEDGEIDENLVDNGYKDVKHSQSYFIRSLQNFSPEHIRLINPHKYRVNLSNDVYDIKKEAINKIEDNFKNVKENFEKIFKDIDNEDED